MKAIALIFVALCALSLVAADSENEINFVFAGLIPSNSGGGGGGGGGGGDCQCDADTFAGVNNLINAWSTLIDTAVGMTSSQVSAAAAQSLPTLVSSDVSLVLSGANSVTGTYSGYAGATAYLQANAAGGLGQEIVMGTATYTEVSDTTVQVSTDYTGTEQLTDGSWETFFGWRQFTVVNYGGSWLISQYSRERYVTYPDTSIVDAVVALAQEWSVLIDAAASVSPANFTDLYGDTINAILSPDVTLNLYGANTVTGTYSGISGAYAFLATQYDTLLQQEILQTITSTEWLTTTSVQVNINFWGWEQSSDGHFTYVSGIRSVVASSDSGSWLITSYSRTRRATFASGSDYLSTESLISQWSSLADAVYGMTPAQVTAYATPILNSIASSDIELTLYGAGSVTGTYSGISGALTYLQSNAASGLQEVLVQGFPVFTWVSPILLQLDLKYNGFIQNADSSYETVFGVRSYQCTLVSFGNWQISSYSRTRKATFAATPYVAAK